MRVRVHLFAASHLRAARTRYWVGRVYRVPGLPWALGYPSMPTYRKGREAPLGRGRVAMPEGKVALPPFPSSSHTPLELSNINTLDPALKEV